MAQWAIRGIFFLIVAGTGWQVSRLLSVDPVLSVGVAAGLFAVVCLAEVFFFRGAVADLSAVIFGVLAGFLISSLFGQAALGLYGAARNINRDTLRNLMRISDEVLLPGMASLQSEPERARANGGLVDGSHQRQRLGLLHGDHHPLARLDAGRVADQNLTQLLPAAVHLVLRTSPRRLRSP